VKLLSATGLKLEVAERIRSDHKHFTRHFKDIVMRMTQLKNPGSLSCKGPSFECISVLDMFGLLRVYPARFFGAPDADHRRYIHAQLRPIFRGNKYHIARSRARVKVILNEFAGIYRELMRLCESLANEYYDDVAGMQASIISRAAFENEPLSYLYYESLHRELDEVVKAYKSSGNAEPFRQAIDKRIAASVRNADALLAQGTARRLPDGVWELQRRTIEGISYSVKVWDDESQTRRLHVCIPVKRNGSRYVTVFRQRPDLTLRQIQSTRLRFTTDSSGSSTEARPRLRRDEELGLVIDFEDICVPTRIGRLECSFYFTDRRGSVCLADTSLTGGYHFVLPDKRELSKIIRQSREHRSLAASV
jgi:hypothetical protein